MRKLARAIATAAWILVLLPSMTWAQASIAGVVRDSSGSVLPGATVEVSSPALIEKVRDRGVGQQRSIPRDRPAAGDIFRRLLTSGFQSIPPRRHRAHGCAHGDCQRRSASRHLQETVTVKGESPIVDVQSVRRQTTLDNEILTTVPTARSWAATAVLIPGIVTQAGASADIQVTPQMTVFGGMGGRGNEGRMQVDGLGTGAALNGGGVSTYVADISNAAEVVTTTSGGLGDAEVGGPTLSIVPKSGGNRTAGQAYLSGVSKGMVGSNFDEELRAVLSTPGKLLKQWDFTGGVGGPIIRDRIWYYATARDEGQHRSIPGIFPNKNAGDPNAWTYEPDTTRQARGAESFQLYSARFSVQATPKNKFNFHWDLQVPCNGAAVVNSADACRKQPDNAVVGALGLGGLSATTSPETAQYLRTLVQNRQLTWTMVATSRLLLEAGVGSYVAKWGPMESPGNNTRGLVRVTEQAARTYNTPNGEVRLWPACSTDPRTGANTSTTRTAGARRWSYVTGAHNMRSGNQGSYMVEDIENHGNDLNLAYTLNNARPSQLTQSLRVFNQKDRVRWDARLRRGPVDDRPHDAAGRVALRFGQELLAGADDRSNQLPADAAAVPEDARRRLVQGPLAARRRGL